MAQRDFTSRDLDLLYEYASAETDAGSQAVRSTLLPSDIADMRRDGISDRQIQRVARAAVIVGTDDGAVRTVVRNYGDQHWRRRRHLRQRRRRGRRRPKW